MTSRRAQTSAILMVSAAGICWNVGCGMQKSGPAPTVLQTRDFVADPATAPTDLRPRRTGTQPAASSAEAAQLPVLSPEAAREGVADLTLVPGAPETPAVEAAPVDPPVLVDGKVGEVNGRPIRVQEIMDELGGRLQAAVTTRNLSDQDRQLLARAGHQQAAAAPVLTRAAWTALAETLIRAQIDTILEEELLQAEARASLRPEQQMGLRYMVQEAAENLRRAEGGSSAAVSRQLESQNKTEQQFKREREAALLVGYQLEQKIRSRVRVSWKDVRLFYERNALTFNPPPTARFRMIRVPADNPEAIEKVRAALAAPGATFEQAASLPENQFESADGGLFRPDKEFSGEYASGSFFADPLNDAARALTPGQWTPEPIDFGSDKVWLYLESIREIHKPLSDRDVQLAIAHNLNETAFRAERQAYIQRLKDRASFTDVDEMTRTLVAIAAERYWRD